TLLSPGVYYVQKKIHRQCTDAQILSIYSLLFLISAGLFFMAMRQSGLVDGNFNNFISGAVLILFPLGLFMVFCAGGGWFSFPEIRYTKKLYLAAAFFLIAWQLLLADGLWLMLLNGNLLKKQPFFWRGIINLVSLLTFLSVLKVFLDSVARVRDSKKISAVKIISALALNFLLLPAVEWSTEHFFAAAEGSSLTAAVSALPQKNLSDSAQRPNVVWIVMDTVRADHVSCYGYKYPTSPSIDKIAAEGIVFENAYATAPWTLPSHASMFTGMYPRTHQTTNAHQFLSSSFTTIAELLHAQGYMTAGFTNNPWVSSATNLHQGFDSFFEGFKFDGESLQWENLMLVRFFSKALGTDLEARSKQQGWCSAYQTNERIRLWLRKTRKPEIPFFIFINYMEAHLPYTAPEPYVRPFLPAAVSYEAANKVNQNFAKYYSGLVKMDKADFAMLGSLYDGEINYLDNYINSLCSQLRSLGILDNTIVIITSDHGDNLGENNKMAHVFSVDDRLLHVPLIIRYPKSVPAGTRVTSIVQTTQIFPTILDMLGITWEGRKTLQGESLFQPPPATKSLSSFGIAELDTYYDGIQAIIQLNRNCFVDKYSRGYKTIRDEQYKYIISSDGAGELYNLHDDPWETTNMIASLPEKAHALQVQLNETFNSLKVPDLALIENEKAGSMDQKTLQGLRDLGYVR
ncbi:MAG: sulfatase-like hydrolase/transferase, partial [Pseudomonadota bacterium]